MGSYFEQVRKSLNSMEDSSILSILPLVRKMALVMGKGSSAAVLMTELAREGVKRGILE